MLYVKRVILPLIVSSFVGFSGTANAKDGPYVSLYSGATFGSKSRQKVGNTGKTNSYDLKSAEIFGGAVGCNYQDFSFDVSYDTRSSTVDNYVNLGDKVKNVSNILLANTAYNFTDLPKVIVPYVGIGVGLAQTKFRANDTTVGKLKNTLAYQVKVGSKFNVHKNSIIYRPSLHRACKSGIQRIYNRQQARN
jgi:hypothetical protein